MKLLRLMILCGDDVREIVVLVMKNLLMCDWQLVAKFPINASGATW